MITLAQQYRELLALTQKHILEEHTGKKWLPTDQEHLTFFRQTLSKKILPPQEPRIKQVYQKSPEPSPTPKPQQQPEKTAYLPPQAIIKEPIEKQEVIPLQQEPIKPDEKKEALPSSSHQIPVFFTLEPVSSPDTLSLEDIKKTIESLSLNISYLPIPSDTEAKKTNPGWKQAKTEPTVIILSFDEEPAERSFLNNVTKAINLCIEPAIVFPVQKTDPEKSWQQIFSNKNIKLIIIADHTLYNFPSLMQYYRESPDKKCRYLGEVPVLLLTNIKFYMQQPNLKKALWKAVCASLGSV